MPGLSEHQLLIGLFALALILLVGRGTAELARRCGQPEVLGELLGGVLLGPSVLGALAPQWHHAVFDNAGVALPLSLFSWTGAILLLMMAGAEVDLSILRQHAKAGSAAAVFTIFPSIAAGTAFGLYMMHSSLPSAMFLGGVLSVTAVSVVAKIFIEHNSFRRDYAQVILAAGIASEVVIWPLISLISSMHEGETWFNAALTTLYAVLFFFVMLTLGQRFINWSMRAITDVTRITFGQLTMLLVMGILFACVTQILGLHALLGPFVFGLLIGRAPRTTARMKENLQALTLSVFAPVFFVTAGMRVDVTKIWSLESLGLILALLAVSSLIKISFGYLGGRVGGMRNWESLLIGLGTNMRGGSDVVVAILGGALALLPEETYSIYAIVAILTVMFSPPLIVWVSKRVPPSAQELDRLTKEEAKKRAYLSGVERVMLPSIITLLPATCVALLKSIASTKDQQNEIFDIVEFTPSDQTETGEMRKYLAETLTGVGENSSVATGAGQEDPIDELIKATKQCDLLLIGANKQPKGSAILSFGREQDRVIDKATSDVLVVVGDGKLLRRAKRILVPVNGLEHAMAAADIASYIAKASEAEVVLLSVVQSEQALTRTQLAYHRLIKAGSKILKESSFRTRRLEIVCREKIIIAKEARAAIVNEIKSGRYDLIVLGAIDRSGTSGIVLGKTVQTILAETSIPAAIVVFHARSGAAPE